MRKIILFFLAIAITVSASVYSILWYMQSEQLKAGTGRIIATMNAKQKVFTYDKLAVTGFPLDLNVEITRPHFNARMDTLLKDLSPLLQVNGLTPSEEQALASISQLPEWSEDITWAGKMRFGVNVFSDRYSFSVDGPVTQVSTMGGSAITLVTTPAGAHECQLQLERSKGWIAALWDTGRLSRDPLELAQDFRQLDCRIAGTSTLDDATKGVIYASGAASFALGHAPQADGSRALSIAFKVRDQEATAAFDNFVNRYVLMFASVPGAPSPLNFAAYGKQQVDLEASVLTPPNFGQMGSGGPFTLTISNLQLENALYTQSGKLSVDNRISGGTRDFSMKGDFTTSFTPAYDQFLSDYALKTVMQIKLSSDPTLAALQSAFAPYSPEQVVEMLRPVIVHLSGFGQIVTHVDMQMQGDEALRKGTLDIRRLEMSSVPYGVLLTGKAGLTGDAQGITPDSKLTLTCRNCTQLISDAGSYAQRAEEVYKKFMPPAAGEIPMPVMVTPQLVEGIQHFIQAVAAQQKDASGATLAVFDVNAVAGRPGALAINGKAVEEVLQLYGQLIAPYLPGASASQPVVLTPAE